MTTPVNWIASYPKSGNTWLRFMLASYLTGTPVTSVRTKVLNQMIPAVGGMVRSGIPEGHLDPLMVKTHSLPGTKAVAPFAEATRSAVYLVRNPRDVMLSLLRHSGAQPGTEQAREFGLTFIAHHGMPQLTDDFEWGSWPQNVRAWATPERVREHFADIDVLVVRYEDLRADPATAMHKILDHLGAGPADPERLAAAVASTSMDNMRSLEQGGEGKVSPDQREGAFRAKGSFVGKGAHNQSLAHLGADVEESYQQLFATDNEFSACAREFGYHG